jgi:hypothetical protein
MKDIRKRKLQLNNKNVIQIKVYRKKIRKVEKSQVNQKPGEIRPKSKNNMNH